VSGEGPGPWHAQECRLVRPLDVYPEFRDEDAEDRGRRTDARRRVERIFLEVATDDGPTGLYGPIDRRQAFLAATCLAPLLLGREALQVETLWDIMVRSDRHARSGHLMMAASAVDCALWDLRGKALGAPVYQLLGGPTRPRVPAYASLLFFSHQPDLLRERALEYRDLGYAAQKWFFRFGPGSGRDGMEANLAMVRTLRETLGEAYDLMFDAPRKIFDFGFSIFDFAPEANGPGPLPLNRKSQNRKSKMPSWRRALEWA
jgi:L-alanine-DL-glutamate epimerase-like enolase superfamily enzyme